MNMVDNAVKYAFRGTSITFEARGQKKTGNLLVEIKSQGMPIMPTELQNIFELGYRGSAAVNSVASGTGLGLHICKKIIEGVHKGNISVTSSREGLTTFIVRFPEYTI
jgi:signal transduction histidine kinase